MLDIEETIRMHFSDEERREGAIFIKDMEHRYLYLNHQLLKVMQYYLGDDYTIDHILGHTDKEIYPQKSYDFCINYDKEVIEKGIPISKFATFKINNVQTLYATVLKIPVFDQGKPVGVLGRKRYLNVFMVDNQTIILSQRELDMLVHVVFGFSFKNIANTLDISLGSVSSYVSRVKDKLKVYTHKELIAKVRKHVLATHIFDYLCKLQDES